MTVASENRKDQHLTDGLTDTFAFNFKIEDDDDLKVYLTNVDDDTDETLLVKTTNYTVTYVPGASAGSITTVSTYATGYRITIKRGATMTQDTSLSNQGGWFPKVHETEFDYLTMLIQQLQEQIDRSVRVAEGSIEDPENYLSYIQAAATGYMTSKIQEFTASAAQTDFVLTTFTVSPDARNAAVFVDGEKVEDSAVTFVDSTTIRLAAMTGGEVVEIMSNSTVLGTGVVETAAIKDAAVTSAKIGSQAVETANIKDAAVTSAKIGSQAVETANIKDLGVTTAKLATREVTPAKIEPHAIIVREYQADTVDGGTFTSGAWRTRDLNLEVLDAGNDITISSGQVTFQPGYYLILGWAVANQVGYHQTAIYNVDTTTHLATGTTAYSATGAVGPSESFVASNLFVNPSSTVTIELQHVCQTTKATDGFGKAGSLGNTEVYAGLIAIKYSSEEAAP